MAAVFEDKGHKVNLEGPRSNIEMHGADGVTKHVLLLRQVRQLKYLDYYVPVQETTLPEEEYALEGELVVENEIKGEVTVVAPSEVKFVNSPPIRDKSTLFHHRLAHIGDTLYDLTVPCVTGLPKRGVHDADCPCCALAKSTVRRVPQNQFNVRATRPGERFHLELIGKFADQSLGGAYYVLVIVDDYSRFTAVHLIPNKSSQTVADRFKEFLAQYCCNMAMLNSVMTDWGSEFDGAFAVYCRENKIQMRKSCPY